MRYAVHGCDAGMGDRYSECPVRCKAWQSQARNLIQKMHNGRYPRNAYDMRIPSVNQTMHNIISFAVQLQLFKRYLYSF